MPSFRRESASRWHEEIPGARWFRADLHLHTLDDHPNHRLKRPAGLSGDASDPAVQTGYARAFLQAAAARGIEVLGLTPHSVRAGDTDETSATWRIVDVWNSEVDDDGVPFREKIYAVFPGFEPSLSDGQRGVHLLFLFDPEIGRDCYLRAFHAVMGGALPWDGGDLRNTGKSAADVFEELDRLRRDEGEGWDYACLAAHAFAGEKGLFGEVKSQMLRDFPSHRLCGLELGDEQVAEEVLASAPPWQIKGMEEHRHALFHASDAYSVNPNPVPGGLFEVGSRFTLIKMATPRIEALRQAFLASESRLRTVYERDQAGELALRSDLPDVLNPGRAWLRSVKIRGGTSFFAGHDSTSGIDREQTFRFSPDLTCVIGGRMSGKSTLLDGLRVSFEHTLPDDERARSDVEERARHVFLSGDPELEFEVRGDSNPTAPMRERWPARFFTQRELQQAVTKQEGLRSLLYRLVPDHTESLLGLESEIDALDVELGGLASEVRSSSETLEEAEQAFASAKQAKEALKTFEDAGVDALWSIQSDAGKVESALSSAQNFERQIGDVAEVASIETPDVANEALIKILDGSSSEPGFSELAASVKTDLESAQATAEKLVALLEKGIDSASSSEADIKAGVARKLVEAGRSSEELNQFETLSTLAAQFEPRKAARDAAQSDYQGRVARFEERVAARASKVEEMRGLMSKVAEAIGSRFEERIRVRAIKNGVVESLGSWITGLRQKGITQWWNDRGAREIGPEGILESLSTDSLDQLGMSARVAESFRETMTGQRKLELRALRCPDKYLLELRVSQNPDQYREMGKLSGGQQVSLLLSLLLETSDDRPIVIDQPEEELDKAYLFDTVLPTLRRLKGQRQIILATHDANIVVNGDADHVLYLNADSDRGWVEEAGAIEKEDVRKAVIRTLDGGKEAFELRKRKYRF